VEPRKTLADFLREDCALTGTHLGCEHGVCGACTVLREGVSVRSCLLLAVQAEGQSVTTIEGLAGARAGLGGPDSELGDELHPIQQAFMDRHGLQCGFCTSGIILTTLAFLRDTPSPSHEEIREMLAGNLCRCTGYHFIVEAIAEAARVMRRAQ
jgi:carbon-monoxide dehydrogenase small subunit